MMMMEIMSKILKVLYFNLVSLSVTLHNWFSFPALKIIQWFLISYYHIRRTFNEFTGSNFLNRSLNLKCQMVLLNIYLFLPNVIIFKQALKLFSFSQVFIKMFGRTVEEEEWKQKDVDTDRDGEEEGRKEDPGVEEDTEEKEEEGVAIIFISFILPLVKDNSWTWAVLWNSLEVDHITTEDYISILQCKNQDGTKTFPLFSSFSIDLFHLSPLRQPHPPAPWIQVNLEGRN